MKKLTSDIGEAVDNDNFSLSTGIPGYTVLQDTHLLEKLAHFNRERIPERVVHAKGGGAYGTFTVTNDLSKYTCAKLFSFVGKKTEMLARFSTVGGEKGSSDSVRDPRGFALKFYTEDGNYDLVGNNTPVFFIRDAIKFPDFIHTQKKDPKTNTKNYNMFWDFLSLNPESMHQTLILFSDRGISKGFRHMHGFGTNTFMWYNNNKEYVWVKYHFLTMQGIDNLTNEEADILSATNPDSSIQDLQNAIDKGEYPSWKVYVQIMKPEEAKEYKFDPFDATKVWYHKDYPLIELGIMTLNRNVKNFFTEIEQAAFSPSHFVTGIGPSPDKLLQGRLMAYPDAHRHRIGVNVNELEVNKAKNSQVANYMKDGNMADTTQGNTKLNYYPNSYEEITVDSKVSPPDIHITGDIARHIYPYTEKDYEQPRELYVRVMTQDKKNILINNITDSLKRADLKLQYRTAALLYIISDDLGEKVSNILNLKLEFVKKLASMSNEERIKNTK